MNLAGNREIEGILIAKYGLGWWTGTTEWELYETWKGHALDGKAWLDISARDNCLQKVGLIE